MVAEQKKYMPVVFIGHGNPMNAIEQNEFHLGWQKLAQTVPRPKAILCISAHWEMQGVSITASEQPETIHDFYGFPKTLFDVHYPAPGDPALAQRVASLLFEEDAQLDTHRGLDHGVWSVLLAMYPQADVPVIQLSIDTSRPGTYHYNLAKKLAPLRDEGVLILGSGNIVHNLRLFSFKDPTPLSWAKQFDEEVKQRVLAQDHEPLIHFDILGSQAKLAVPTPEHYLPLLYVLALQAKHEALGIFNNKVLSSISMTSIIVGKI